MSEREDGLMVTNRYDALGMPLPDPATVCQGACEGTGWVPVRLTPGGPISDGDAGYMAAWEAAEAANPSEDGWHFLPCLDCGGTGKRSAGH